jgi:hypothetical protein
MVIAHDFKILFGGSVAVVAYVAHGLFHESVFYGL